MRFCRILAAIVAACSFASCSPTQTDDVLDAGVAFHALLDEHWAAAKAEKVFFRTDPDAWRMDGELSEHTSEARARRRDFNEHILAALAEISTEDLNAEDRLSYRVFKYERETERESYRQPDHFFPITSLFGYHTYFAEAPANSVFLSPADYDDYLISLADFSRYNRDYIEVLREAIDAGYTHYCESIADYASTIEAHIVGDAEQSGLYVPFTRFPGIVNEDQRAQFIHKGVELIDSVVVPVTRNCWTSLPMSTCRLVARMLALLRYPVAKTTTNI